MECAGGCLSAVGDVEATVILLGCACALIGVESDSATVCNEDSSWTVKY